MENQQTTLDKAVKISIVAGALIVALSVAYYLVVYIPQRDNAKIEQQEQEQQAKEEQQQAIEKQKASDKWALEDCLAEADSNYWAYAKLNGTEKKDGTVYADNDVWDRAEKTKQADIANCYRKYPQ